MFSCSWYACTFTSSSDEGSSRRPPWPMLWRELPQSPPLVATKVPPLRLHPSMSPARCTPTGEKRHSCFVRPHLVFLGVLGGSTACAASLNARALVQVSGVSCVGSSEHVAAEPSPVEKAQRNPRTKKSRRHWLSVEQSREGGERER